MNTRTIEDSCRLTVFYCVESQGAVLILRDKSGNAFASAHIVGEGLDAVIETLTRIRHTPESVISNSILGTPCDSRGAE